MNEQIKQLALQSQLVYETADGKVYNSWEDYVDLTEYATINAYQHETPGSYVLKHFGVE